MNLNISKKYVAIAIIITGLIGLLFAFMSTRLDGIITVNNQSDYPIYNMVMVYQTSHKQDAIGQLLPQSSYDYRIVYNDTEDSILLQYTDHHNQVHTLPAASYVAKYDKQHYVVTIK